MDLDPFTRLIWKSKRDKDIWEDRIREVSRLYSYTEYRTFEIGLRKAITFHVNLDNRLEEVFEILADNNLVFLPIRRSRLYSGFSHKHIDPRPGDPQFIYGVLSKRKNIKYAKLFRDNSIGHTSHIDLGKILGYPSCCISFFNKVWGTVIDPIYEQASTTENSGGIKETSFHPFCNQGLRYWGIRITPHLCCSPDCDRTIKIGSKWFDIMKSKDKEAAGWMLELLSMEYTWDCLRGVAIVDTPIFRGVTNSDFTERRKIVKNKGWNKSV